MKIKVKITTNENMKQLNVAKDTLIELDYEEYIAVVVASEIGNSPIEACKAQAVAARTLARSRAYYSGEITDSSSIHQAFRASRMSLTNYPNALKATQETAGEVLAYNGKLAGHVIYGASNGGRTVSSKEKYGNEVAYLPAKDDPYDAGTLRGHGVGMSQTGAIAMAKAGWKYYQILEFYYPGTEIAGNYNISQEMSPVVDFKKSKAQLVVEYAYSKLGCGYIWGAIGQIATESYCRSRANADPAHVDYDIVKKWIGKQVFDCRGFVLAAMKQVGIKMSAVGATTQWKETKFIKKGTIDTLPKDKVCCLYRYDSSTGKMAHTLLYLGDGETIIHSSGSNTGVQITTLSKYNRATHWGIPAGLYNDDLSDSYLTISGLKKDDVGYAVTYLQELLLAAGESMPSYGADGSFGGETLNALKSFQAKRGLPQSGIVDAATEKALTGIEPAKKEEPKKEEPKVVKVMYQAKVQPQTSTTVNMRSAKSTSSDVVTKVAGGQIVDVIEEGKTWCAIEWNGKSGYMMTKFLVKIEDQGSGKSGKWYVKIACDSEEQAKAIASILAKAQAST